MSTPLRYLTPIIFIKVAQLDTTFPHIKLLSSLNSFAACKNRAKFVEIHKIRQNTKVHLFNVNTVQTKSVEQENII